MPMGPKIDYTYIRAGLSLWMYLWSISVGIIVALAVYHLPASLRPNYTTTPPPPTQIQIMAVAPALKFLTVPAAAKHTATVIFVHVSILPACALSRPAPAFLNILCAFHIFHLIRDWAILVMAGNPSPTCLKSTPRSPM